MSVLGSLYVISAPSGTGKTTLVKTLVDSLPNITVSISHTTRAKRSAEINGVNYHFVSENEFRSMIAQNDFLEYATVFHHFYGTSRRSVEETLKKGIDVILEIDWQGCQQIQRLMKDCISIFILPPSVQALEQRLTQRNQDNSDIIQKRLKDAEETISHVVDYDYIVLNDDLQTALHDLQAIIHAKRLGKARQLKNLAEILKELSFS